MWVPTWLGLHPGPEDWFIGERQFSVPHHTWEHRTVPLLHWHWLQASPEDHTAPSGRYRPEERRQAPVDHTVDSSTTRKNSWTRVSVFMTMSAGEG